MKNPIISIVMPAYNVEKYIAEAVESVLRQTFHKWELIIVDDCSVDATWEILNKYNDPRIIKLRRNKNSGSAYVPRSEAVFAANGEWIINLDADDYIESTYIEKLLNKAMLDKVDVCAPQMIGVGEKGDLLGFKIPADEFDFEKVYQNKEAFNYTVPVWKIGMNGAMVKRSLWKKALGLYEEKNKKLGIHDDENLSRILLLEAERVSVCKSNYFIRSNPTSVTKRFTLQIFEWMYANIELKEIVKQRFGELSQEYKNVIFYDFLCYNVVLKEFVDNLSDENIFLKGYALLKKWHNNIEWEQIDDRLNFLKQKMFKCLNMSVICIMVKCSNIVGVKVVFNCIKKKINSRLKNNKFYAWYIVRREREKEIRKKLSRYYLEKKSEKSYDSCVVCIYDGMIEAGGLADRLKGIIGTYEIAKSKGLHFKLYFKNPFPLEDFLVPNNYDWRIEKKDICLESKKVKVVVLDNTQDSKYQLKKQKEYLRKKIKQEECQVHVYTNASFSYDLEYSKLYNELFIPTERLQKSIDNQKKLIGSKYISISCRFLDLLGDFNETCSCGTTLSNDEKQLLLERIDGVLLELHKNNPDMKILVNSDSKTFLKKYVGEEFTYVIPGNITHIDAKQGIYSYDQYEKTFLDFMMIANAEKVYLIKSRLMHKSGYPYAASKIYGKPFEIIEI